MSRARHVLAALALLGCVGGDGSSDALPARCPTASAGERSAIVTHLGFARQATPGVTEGFDLDGRDNGSMGDADSCRRRDFVDPSGRRGIDNQISIFAPALDAATAGAFEPLVNAAINNGQLLIGVTVDHLDDPRNDDCVEVVFLRASGMPFVGTDMVLDPGQTFAVDRTQTITRVSARLRDGVIETGAFELPLPVSVLTANFILNLRHARARITLDDKGAMHGTLGGGISVPDLVAVVRTFDIPTGLMTTVETQLRQNADLDADPEGVCQLISAAMTFTARGAFFNP